jgi:hypothetical protein
VRLDKFFRTSGSPARGGEPLRDPDARLRLKLRSGIMPVLRERLFAAPGSCVLDLGPPSTNKFSFFTGAPCRFYTNNLPDNLFVRLATPGTAFNDEDFQELVPQSGPSGFDVVLAWDYFDYLQAPALKSLCTWLGKHCRPGALIYFLISHAKAIPDAPAHIDLIDDDHLRYESGPLVRETNRLAPRVLEGLMPNFRIHKLYLLGNGVQEHLYSYQPSPALVSLAPPAARKIA